MNSLKDLRSLIAPGHFPYLAHSQSSLKNTIDSERDSVKVAVYKFLSDHLERSTAGIVDALKGCGYDSDTVVCAVNSLVNDGYLVSHRYGNATDPQDVGVRLMEGKIMPEAGDSRRPGKPGVYRHVIAVSRRDPHGMLNHRDGVETAIWKAMQDHVVRSLDTVVEIVGVAGFAPALVRGEIMLLEQRGWFEIDRCAAVPTYRLKEEIDEPLQPGADPGHARKEVFDPAQPAVPGSLLAKVQEAQRALDDTAGPAHPYGRPASRDGNDERTKGASLDTTGCDQICKVLAGGEHLTTMEISSALKAGGTGISRGRIYELIRRLYQDGVLCRDKTAVKGVNVAYRYWLAQGLSLPDEPGATPGEEALLRTSSDGPLVISVHLRGVELSLQECGELLREVGDLWLLRRLSDGRGLIQSRFTIKGIDLSLAELREVASCLAQAAVCLGSGSRYPRMFDDDVFPDCTPAT
ncbi:hypothetical protein HDG34_003369 [Paraburkholderia sp. HC6.4b]|uniref:hypothetical protein n=1 Tax=unclassified Paraburkholderia TaxID=2615204 RepID=UPI00161042D0|nr:MULTISPECIES: hypothetical protein [unclassified Paraburkholderia]MBB5409428.1 hypothetical protein [Paraburkholderia sp. HC6.4b]MBB5451158.1 hypothetical protein [Paraburkholderia sp. Kb1A]